MPLAIIEFSGAERLKGVYVADADPAVPPDTDFTVESEEFHAEQVLADTIDAVRAGEFTWEDVLRLIAEAQDLQVNVRYIGETTFTAPELLEHAQAQLAAGSTPDEVTFAA